MNTKGKTKKIVVKFKATYQQYNELWNLLESGKLEQMLGVPVAHLEAYSLPQTAQQPDLEAVINLGECLRQVQENFTALTTTLQQAGCNLIQNVFEPPYIASELALAYAYAARPRGEQKSIEDLITRLDNTEKDNDRLLLAKELAQQCSPESKESPQKNVGKAKAIATLVKLIKETKEEEIWWQAVESLSIVSPEAIPQTVIAFSENIGLRLLDYPLKLYVGFSKRDNDDVSVYLRLYPQNITDILPNGIKLIVLYNGEIYQEIVAEEITKMIMYKVIFESGDNFNVRVALEKDSITTRTYIA